VGWATREPYIWDGQDAHPTRKFGMFFYLEVPNCDYRSFIPLVRLNFKPYFGVSPRRRTRVCVAAISNRLDYSLSRVIEERYSVLLLHSIDCAILNRFCDMIGF
jgi:hypothetical protein